ncbi:GPW/gp25 family protein [Halpernia frigidisoli]|uniref:Gene 25-like lysozyme n=1 Tax=Halpernia frigidisoli TaxID=1125876 RepID=A0A1I3IQT7_9FLAO|nr:GPW/gp25 family protein [Halpernia frigidisoli]SFI50282.1 Gene 25-like lysozyme [Halpernia frigidisoli]
MDNENYRIPLNPLSMMMSNGHIDTCGIAESIAQNIMLLIITKKGENRYDEQYGNDVWDLEFDNGVTSSSWENIFVKSLQRQIEDYEPRLTSAKVQASIKFVEHNYETKGFLEVKKKVKIIINAKLDSTGEAYNFSTEIFLSPMSID